MSSPIKRVNRVIPIARGVETDGPHRTDLGPIPGAAALLGVNPHHYRIWIRTFGTLRVYLDDKEIPPSAWPYPKVRSLFRLLLIHDGFLPLDYVAENIWSSLTPERARQNFSVALHHLRRTLEPDRPKHHPSTLLVYRNQQVRLNHGQVLTDRGLFLRLAQKAEQVRSKPQLYGQVLEHMVRLYAGPLFEEEAYEDWCSRERDHLQEMYLLARQELAGRALQEQNYLACLRHCESVLGVDPLRESVHLLLMQTYRGMGDRARAMAHYHKLRELLDEELGIEPSTRIKEIYMALLHA